MLDWFTGIVIHNNNNNNNNNNKKKKKKKKKSACVRLSVLCLKECSFAHGLL
jgi:hypothetical protein